MMKVKLRHRLADSSPAKLDVPSFEITMIIASILLN